jgi:hypothetical protein
VLALASRLCINVGADGLRGELTLMRSARRWRRSTAPPPRRAITSRGSHRSRSATGCGATSSTNRIDRADRAGVGGAGGVTVPGAVPPDALAEAMIAARLCAIDPEAGRHDPARRATTCATR